MNLRNGEKEKWRRILLSLFAPHFLSMKARVLRGRSSCLLADRAKSRNCDSSGERPNEKGGWVNGGGNVKGKKMSGSKMDSERLQRRRGLKRWWRTIEDISNATEGWRALGVRSWRTAVDSGISSKWREPGVSSSSRESRETRTKKWNVLSQ